jgi:hypothetical protein
MVDYLCPACGVNTPIDPEFRKKIKHCPNCGDTIPAAELHRLLEEQLDRRRQEQNRRAYLPLLLSFALLVAVIIGAVAWSLTVMLSAAGILLLLAWLVYHWTADLITQPSSLGPATHHEDANYTPQRRPSNVGRRSPV